MDKGKCGSWAALFALVAAVGVTASTPALADKGSQGRALGVPDVNLALPKMSGPGAAAGPFVPTPQLYVAPGLMRGPLGNGSVPGAAAPGASGLTPSHGPTPPGRLATPGLRLGHGNFEGAMPSAPNPTQPGDGNGFALGHRDDAIHGVSQAAAREPAAATNRITASSHGADRGTSQASEPTPRQLPTCR
jgi:hypothetical protein